jgi:hypothetical protein
MTDSKADDLVKVLVRIERDEDGYPPADHESLWATAIGDGHFKIDNIPFFATGISVGDVVEASSEQGALHYRRVVQASGHSTLRLIIYDEAQTPTVREHFRRLGCSTEQSHIPGLVAVDVPPSIALDALKRELDAGVEQGRWDYEEASLGTSGQPS